MANGLPQVRNGRPIDPQVRTLVEKFGGVKRGELLEHDILSAAINLDRKKPRDYTRYCQIVRHFVDRVEKETGIRLKTYAGVGYRAYSTAEEQLSHEVRRAMKTADRGLKRVGEAATRIPDSQLPDRLRSEKSLVIGKATEMIAAHRTQLKVFNVRLGLPEANPKILPP